MTKRQFHRDFLTYLGSSTLPYDLRTNLHRLTMNYKHDLINEIHNWLPIFLFKSSQCTTKQKRIGFVDFRM